MERTHADLLHTHPEGFKGLKRKSPTQEIPKFKVKIGKKRWRRHKLRQRQFRRPNRARFAITKKTNHWSDNVRAGIIDPERAESLPLRSASQPMRQTPKPWSREETWTYKMNMPQSTNPTKTKQQAVISCSVFDSSSDQCGAWAPNDMHFCFHLLICLPLRDQKDRSAESLLRTYIFQSQCSSEGPDLHEPTQRNPHSSNWDGRLQFRQVEGKEANYEHDVQKQPTRSEWKWKHGTAMRCEERTMRRKWKPGDFGRDER